MDLRTSKTKLFLIELIIIILFFSIAGAVCMNLFTQAKMMSVGSTDITNAMLEGQSAAEMVRDVKGEELVNTVYPSAVVGADGYSVFYDDAWKVLPGAEGAAYELRVTYQSAGEDLLSADITVQKGDTELFHVQAKRYIGDGAVAGYE